MGEGFVFFDAVELVGAKLAALEGILAINHLEQHYSEGPDVGLLGVGVGLDCFRCHMHGGADYELLDNAFLLVGEESEAEVGKLEGSLGSKNIGWLDVAVDDS